MGLGGAGSSLSPALVVNNYHWVSISTGGYANTCGVTTGFGVFCWGDSEAGKLGNNDDTTDVNRPTTVHLFVDTKNSTIAAVVDPSLTFTVGSHAGACNGVAAQDLAVSTNATTDSRCTRAAPERSA